MELTGEFLQPNSPEKCQDSEMVYTPTTGNSSQYYPPQMFNICVGWNKHTTAKSNFHRMSLLLGLLDNVSNLCSGLYFVCFSLHSCCIIVSAVGWTWWDWSLIL